MDEFEKDQRRWRKRRIFRPRPRRSQRSWVLTALVVVALVFMIAALPDVDEALTGLLGLGE